MSDAPQNAKGEGVQSTCAKCGGALKMGWTAVAPRRPMLMPCEKCQAAIVPCPHCGGSGVARDASQGAPAKGAA